MARGPSMFDNPQKFRHFLLHKRRKWIICGYLASTVIIILLEIFEFARILSIYITVSHIAWIVIPLTLTFLFSAMSALFVGLRHCKATIWDQRVGIPRKPFLRCLPPFSLITYVLNIVTNAVFVGIMDSFSDFDTRTVQVDGAVLFAITSILPFNIVLPFFINSVYDIGSSGHVPPNQQQAPGQEFQGGIVLPR